MTDKERKNPRRATIMRGVVTPIFGLLAVTFIALGLLNATEWKPNAQVEATAVSDTRYTVTDPGLLSLVDDDVTVDVSSSASTKLCVVSGLSRDIAGWIAGHDYTRLTGLSSWSSISTAAAKATGSVQSQDGDVTLEQSDMWAAVTCGTGSVSVKRTADDNALPLLIDTNADAAADNNDSAKLTVTMHWTRSTLPDYATPLYFIGGMCALAAVLSASLFAMHPSKRRKKGADVETPAARVREEIEITIPHLVFGAVGSFFGAIASMLHLGGAKRHRRHARRAAGTTPQPEDTRLDNATGVAATTGVGGVASSVAPGPVVVDVGARNLVAEQAAQASEQATDQTAEPERTEEASAAETTVEEPDAAGRTAEKRESADEEATTVITPEDFAAYFARVAAEEAASKSGADDAGDDHANDEGKE
ncbi:hypothetical protein [Bifidobacterium avesanii]|uniref:Uncharacterized protein n=1 Tax=Bifidobacterium avesanii TaxID=1798157 RepID=A0A7K3TIS2_9BIFI|nr:hypothetical protein [Bifidobacterium avesanii]NEG79008.1 hypothetical protein [Bifidobacterium avesanii]